MKDGRGVNSPFHGRRSFIAEEGVSVALPLTCSSAVIVLVSEYVVEVGGFSCLTMTFVYEVPLSLSLRSTTPSLQSL